MKITFNRDQVKRALTKFVGLEKDVTVHCIEPIAFMTSRDGVVRLEVRSRNMTVSSVIEGRADQDGEVSVSYGTLKCFVRNSTVATAEVIREGGSTFIFDDLSSYGASGGHDYGELRIDAGDVVGSFKISAFDLLEMLRKTTYAMHTDTVCERRSINCIRVELDGRLGNARFVGTDGRIMAIANTPVNTDATTSFNVSAESIPVLKRLLKSIPAAKLVTVNVHRKHLSVSVSGVEYVSALHDPAYPRYDVVVPRGARVRITVDRKALVDAFKTVGQLLRVKRGDDRYATLSYNNGKIGVGEIRINFSRLLKAQCSGTISGDIKLDTSYMVAALESLDSDYVTLHLGIKRHPEAVRITCDIPVEVIVMPVRTTDNY